MQNRLDGCLKLLDRSRRRRNGTKPVVEWLTPPETSFERPCHGVYESCNHRECFIKTAQKPTEKITDDPQPSNSKTNPTSDVAPTCEDLSSAQKQLLLQVKYCYLCFVECTAFTFLFIKAKQRLCRRAEYVQGGCRNDKR